MTAGATDTTARMTIMTDHGAVTHVGTQYMTRADGSILTISVREGEVRLESQSTVESASAGQQLQIQGGTAVSVVNIKPYGENWQWIEQMSPSISTQGRSIDELIAWVSHETGLDFKYGSEEVEGRAKKGLLIGPENIDSEPMSALEFWMPATDLTWSIEDGVIHISNSGNNGQNSEIQN